jgi:hypothetical protein
MHSHGNPTRETWPNPGEYRTGQTPQQNNQWMTANQGRQEPPQNSHWTATNGAKQQPPQDKTPTEAKMDAAAGLHVDRITMITEAANNNTPNNSEGN